MIRYHRNEPNVPMYKFERMQPFKARGDFRNLFISFAFSITHRFNAAARLPHAQFDGTVKNGAFSNEIKQVPR